MMDGLVDLRSAEFRQAAKEVMQDELKAILMQRPPDDHIALMLYEQIKDSAAFRQEILGDITDFKTEVADRFKQVEGRLDRVEGRLDRIEGRLEKVELKLDQVPTKAETVQLINQQTEKVIDSVRKMFQEYHQS